MALTFYKFHGAGNDFIIIDDRESQFSGKVRNPEEFIKMMCNRHFGIGADGLILLKNSDAAEFSMIYFNSDGLEGSLCGNGGRCLVAFAQSCGIFYKETVFLASDGLHKAIVNINEKNLWDISLKMNDVGLVSKHRSGYLVNTGSPHIVLFLDNISETDVYNQGRAIRNNKEFGPYGINVNFVEIISTDTLKMRTYERGVENETLACGTGATAVALAAWTNGVRNSGNHYILQAPGGRLRVNFSSPDSLSGHFTDIWLSGPAQKVFEGKIQINE